MGFCLKLNGVYCTRIWGIQILFLLVGLVVWYGEMGVYLFFSWGRRKDGGVDMKISIFGYSTF